MTYPFVSFLVELISYNEVADLKSVFSGFYSFSSIENGVQEQSTSLERMFLGAYYFYYMDTVTFWWGGGLHFSFWCYNIFFLIYYDPIPMYILCIFPSTVVEVIVVSSSNYPEELVFLVFFGDRQYLFLSNYFTSDYLG